MAAVFDHKKRSDNPDCTTDLIKCEFCGVLALNEYGISIKDPSKGKDIFASVETIACYIEANS